MAANVRIDYLPAKERKARLQRCVRALEYGTPVTALEERFTTRELGQARMIVTERKRKETAQRFPHAWHWITASSYRTAPYWFCAKCGTVVQTTRKPACHGCPEEK